MLKQLNARLGLGRSGGESGGDGEVRVWRNVLISAGTVATTL